MKKIVALGIICLLGLWVAVVGFAATAAQTPNEVVQAVSDALLTELRAQKAAIEKDPEATLYTIVKQVVLPYIDIEGMIRETLGRQGNQQWDQLSADKKNEFIDQFIRLVVKTYSAALKEYKDESVKVFPMREFNEQQTRAQVNSQILSNSGSPINIEYTMVKVQQSWKVRDFSVEGISLVNSYQAQFQSIIDDKGVSGLIDTLKQHNDSAS